jgi:amino acid transporter
MLVMLVATIAWGWLSFSALPYAFAGNYGAWGTNTQAWFVAIIALMAFSTFAGFFGLQRTHSAHPV